jgi:hypothetical protein
MQVCLLADKFPVHLPYVVLIKLDGFAVQARLEVAGARLQSQVPGSSRLLA